MAMEEFFWNEPRGLAIVAERQAFLNFARLDQLQTGHTHGVQLLAP
jgi:hypothetical protein